MLHRLLLEQALHAMLFSRVAGMLNGTKGTVAFGGKTDRSDKYVSPTFVTDVKLDDVLMKDEVINK